VIEKHNYIHEFLQRIREVLEGAIRNGALAGLV